jgi:hypothetical protein
MRPHPATAAARTRGLTLVEIMVAATISGLVITSVLSVLLQTLKAYSYENGQLNVNLDVRKFTNQLTADALPASYFRVFDSSTALGGGATALNSAVAAGGSGDCVLFVYKDATDDTKFAKLVIYFRVPDANNEGAVHRLVVNFANPATGPVTALIPTLDQPPDTYPTTIGLARGLGAGGKLFTDFNDRSVVVNGEIIRTATGQFRRASHTFGFSVTPRS